MDLHAFSILVNRFTAQVAEKLELWKIVCSCYADDRTALTLRAIEGGTGAKRRFSCWVDRSSSFEPFQKDHSFFLSRYDSTPQKGDSKSQKAQLGLALQQRFRKESQRGPEVVAENDDWEWMREQKTVGTNARDRGGALYIAQLYYKASRLTTIAITTTGVREGPSGPSWEGPGIRHKMVSNTKWRG